MFIHLFRKQVVEVLMCAYVRFSIHLFFPMFSLGMEVELLDGKTNLIRDVVVLFIPGLNQRQMYCGFYPVECTKPSFESCLFSKILIKGSFVIVLVFILNVLREIHFRKKDSFIFCKQNFLE